MPTPPHEKSGASRFQAPVSVGRFLVLLPPHSSAVKERRNGHANHDANRDSNATEKKNPQSLLLQDNLPFNFPAP